MPEAAAQPFVTSQRPSGVPSRAATQDRATIWTWQSTPNPTIEAGRTTTRATRPGCDAPNEQNKLGSYYCWNRIYEPSTGRWTTPDPAMSPWSNLWDYSMTAPAVATDPTGLTISVTQEAWNKGVSEAFAALCPSAQFSRQPDGTITGGEEFCDRTVKRKVWVCTDKEGASREMGRYEEIEETILGSWRNAATHKKGCELLGLLICSDCKVNMKMGSPSRYIQDKQKKLGAAGVGGTVKLNFNEKWHTWAKDRDGVWRKQAASTVSKPRVVAHELAHALRGCNGDYIPPSDSSFEDFKGRATTEYKGAKIGPYYDGKGQPLGNPEAIAKGLYHNREEQDVIDKWENPIAEELGENPRFGHQ